MLRLDDVVISYGSAVAVKGISLEVKAGEVVGLVGPNGAGKSTTIGGVMGFNKIAAGKISLFDEDLDGAEPEAVARSGVSLVPEGRQIFATMTVAENLRLGASARNDRAEIEEDCSALCERFPILGKRFRQAAGELSGGEQQQLAIARALVARPKLVMFDEPTLGLAPLMVDAVFRTIEELRGEGITVLLVEQNALRTIAVADRTYILRNGRISLEGSREELSDRTDIASHFLGL
jgi:branched-chain amino acid transport system ATP-binding protein